LASRPIQYGWLLKELLCLDLNLPALFGDIPLQGHVPAGIRTWFGRARCDNVTNSATAAWFNAKVLKHAITSKPFIDSQY
jgi:hypothetical protein